MIVVCVNALWRANFISTNSKNGKDASLRWVSMPCGGLTPFLLKYMEMREYMVMRVNALWRANSISTLFV